MGSANFLCHDFTSGSANFSDTKAKAFGPCLVQPECQAIETPRGFSSWMNCFGISFFLRGSRCNHCWTDLSHLKHKRKREIKYWFSSVESCDRIISYPISFTKVIGSRESGGKYHLVCTTYNKASDDIILTNCQTYIMTDYFIELE